MGRRMRVAAAVVFALAAIATGVRAAEAGHPLRVGPDRVITPGGLIDANNSPSVAVDPTDAETLVVAHRVDRPTFGAMLERTDDGGVTWSRVQLPLPAGLDRPFSPDVTFGPDGRLYVAYAHLEGPGNVPAALWVARSDDAGLTINDPVRVAGSLAFQARIVVGPEGNVYLTWLQAAEVGLLRLAGEPNPIVLARSEDGGATWSEPVLVSDPARVRVAAASPVVAEDGSISVLYQDFKGNRRDFEFLEGPSWPEPSALVLARSTDEGRTFGEGVEIDAGVVGTRRFLVFLPEFPSLAADREWLHVAWADGRNGDLDVFTSRSNDGGATWSEAMRVNDDPPGGGATQYLPRVVAGGDGTVAVLYLDRRSDPEDRRNETWLAASDDHGAAFDNVRVSAAASDASVGPSAAPAFEVDFGSRLGLAAAGSRLVAVWTDTRDGTLATGRQDIAIGTVELATSAGAARWVLPAVMVVLCAASLVLHRRSARLARPVAGPTARGIFGVTDRGDLVGRSGRS